MIRQLRQRHRKWILGWSLSLPLAFAVAVAMRQPAAVMGSLPPALTGDLGDFGKQLWQRDDLWSQQLIPTRLLINESGQLAIALGTGSELSQPDPILYWKPSSASSESTLSEAVVLGAQVDGRCFLLPDAARNQPGQLLLYSLANRELLAISSVFAANPE